MNENKGTCWQLLPRQRFRGVQRSIIQVLIAWAMAFLLLFSLHYVMKAQAPYYPESIAPVWSGQLREDTVFDPAGNPHIINSNLTVAEGVTLTILPGAEVRLAEDVSIFVRGRLLAEGTPTQTIRFTWHAEGHYWDRIFIDSHADAQGQYADNRIAYAEIAHLKGVHAQFSMLHLLNNEIHDVYGDAVVSTSGATVIQGNHIYDVAYNPDIRSCEGIQLRETPPESPAYILDNHVHHVADDCIDINDSSAIVRRNHLHHCHDKGISLGTRNETPSPDYYPATATIVNNLVYASDLGIAVKDYAFATILHNTLVSNSTGLALYQAFDHYNWGGGRARAVNNIIWYNQERAIDLDLETSPPAELAITYSDIEGGWEGEGNLDINPLFQAAEAADFRLHWDSPLINAGHDEGITVDLTGQSRPHGPAPDIGAYESHEGLWLSAHPGDRQIYLTWHFPPNNPLLASFAISCTRRYAGSITIALPPLLITDVLSTTRAYTMTGLSNYVWHRLTIEARDMAGVVLERSNAVNIMPTNIYVYLPIIMTEFE